MTYNPANPPSSLAPALQQYLVQELRRISTEIGRAAQNGGDPEPGPYTQNLVDNNGTGRLVATNSGVLQDLIPGDEFMLSVWTQSNAVTTNWIFQMGTAQNAPVLRLRWNVAAAVSTLNLLLSHTGNNDVFNGTSIETIDRTQLLHILIARSGTTIKTYIDGVEWTWNNSPNADVQAYDEMDTASICSDVGGVVELDQNIGDVWYYAGQYLDLDIEANRRLFIDENGDPVGLGDTGEIPVGATPDIFVGGPMLAADWNDGTNLGTFGNFVHGGPDFTDVE